MTFNFPKALVFASALLSLSEAARSEDSTWLIPVQNLDLLEAAPYLKQNAHPIHSEADRFLSVQAEKQSPDAQGIQQTLSRESGVFPIAVNVQSPSDGFIEEPSSFFSMTDLGSSGRTQSIVVSSHLGVDSEFSVPNTNLQTPYLDDVWDGAFSASAELQRVFQYHYLSRLHLDLLSRAQSERAAFETALQNQYEADAADFMLMNHDLIKASVNSSRIDKALRAINTFPHLETESFRTDARNQLEDAVTAFQEFRKRSIKRDGRKIVLNDERSFSAAFPLFRMRFPDKTAQDYSNFMATGHLTPPNGYGGLIIDFPFDHEICDTCMVLGPNGVTSYRVVGEDGTSRIDLQGGYVIKGCNRSESRFEIFIHDKCPKYTWDATDYPMNFLLPADVTPQMEIDLTNLVPAVILLLPNNRVLGLAEGNETYRLFKSGTPLEDANSSTIYDTRHCTAFPNQDGTHVYTAAHCLTAIWGSPVNDEIFELDLGTVVNCEHITTAVFLARVWEKGANGEYHSRDVHYCKTVRKLGSDFVIVELDRPIPQELISGLDKVTYPQDSTSSFTPPSEGQTLRRRAFSIGFPRNYTIHTSVGGYFAPDSNCLATYEMFYASPYFMRSRGAEPNSSELGLKCTSLDTFMGMSGAPVFALFESGRIELVGAVSWAISSRWSEEELSRNENSDDGLESALEIFNVYASLVPL